MPTIAFLMRVCITALTLAACQAALAQDYPTKPIRLLAAMGAGGTGDTMARLLASEMTKLLGQPVVVESRPAAGGSVALESVANSAPDGYTLVFTGPALIVNPLVRNTKGVGSNLADFAPIAEFATTSEILVVNPAVPASNLTELIAYAKKNPGRLNYGSAGVGSFTNLSVELLKQRAKIEMVHVPFQGGTAMRVAVISNQVQVAVDGLSSALPFIKEGKLRAIALVNSKRSAIAPEVATVDEAGLKGYAADVWYGILAPRGTPQPIVSVLNAAIARIARNPDIRGKLAGEGTVSIGGTPSEFQTMLDEEAVRWGAVVHGAGLTEE